MVYNITITDLFRCTGLYLKPYLLSILSQQIFQVVIDVCQREY